jgi:membrane protein required for colicin V production
VNWVDFAILLIVLLSSVISLLRGFVREALSLANWVLAIWVSISFAYNLATLLKGSIDSPNVRVSVAFGILFLSTLIVGALVIYLISQLVRKTGMSGTDRMLGVVFGVARGVMVVGILVLLAGLTELPKENWWKDSMLLPHFQNLALWIRDFLPADVAKSFVYK